MNIDIGSKIKTLRLSKSMTQEQLVADQIRFYRRQEGLTQEQLAEAMGVSVAAVSKWEQGVSHS